MATALAESFDAPQDEPNDGKPGTGQDNGEPGGEPQERDYEAEARQHGWVPKDEFKGDPTRWTDAETFVKKADEVMPLLRKQNTALKRELEDVRKQIKRASEHFSKSEERAYERALNDLKARQEKAVADGDVEAFRAVDKELDELRKDTAPKAKAAEVNPLDVKEALIDFRDANPWYDAGGKERDYADLLAEKYADKTESMQPAEFFSFIAEKVLERYPAAGKGKADDTRRRSPVEGAGNMGRPSRSGRSFNDLPPEAQRMCDKWVKSGLIKSRDDYVKTYQWDDK